MAETYTSNLGLVKPDYDSFADISVINSNMDKIDNAVANAGKVKSVNKKTGDVTLTAANVGARPDTWTPTASDVGALPSDGTAVNAAQLNGKSADQYMLKTDTAADSEKLGGVAASEYIQHNDALTLEEIEASTDLTGKLPSAQALADGVGKIGKLLWAGSFSSGSITVPGVESYSVIAVKAANAIMIGSKNYGIGGNLAYGGIENKTLAYRVAPTSENILSITDIDRGCYTSDGTMYPITEIYGVF